MIGSPHWVVILRRVCLDRNRGIGRVEAYGTRISCWSLGARRTVVANPSAPSRAQHLFSEAHHEPILSKPTAMAMQASLRLWTRCRLTYVFRSSNARCSPLLADLHGTPCSPKAFSTSEGDDTHQLGAILNCFPPRPQFPFVCPCPLPESPPLAFVKNVANCAFWVRLLSGLLSCLCPVQMGRRSSST